MAGLDKPQPSIQEIAEAFNAFAQSLWSTLQPIIQSAVITFNEAWASLNRIHQSDPDGFHMLVASKMGREVDCPICKYREKHPEEEGK